MLPSTFQHDPLGLVAVANNCPAIGPFLILSLLIRPGDCVLGTAVLKFFGIIVSAFQIAGGLLLGFRGRSPLGATDPGDSYDKNGDVSPMDVGPMTSSAIEPIYLSLITGAGRLSTITVYSSGAP